MIISSIQLSFMLFREQEPISLCSCISKTSIRSLWVHDQFEGDTAGHVMFRFLRQKSLCFEFCFLESQTFAGLKDAEDGLVSWLARWIYASHWSIQWPRQTCNYHLLEYAFDQSTIKLLTMFTLGEKNLLKICWFMVGVGSSVSKQL